MSLAFPLILAAAAGVGPGGFDCDVAIVEGLGSGDCTAKFGRLIDVRTGPQIAGKPTIEVRYELVRGKTVHPVETALLQRHGAGYRLLWRHRLVDASYGFGPFGSPDYAIPYHWSYDAPRRRIVVTGSRTANRRLARDGSDLKRWLAQPRGESQRLAPRFYCYSQEGRFEPCAGT